ncbi:putative nuclease HARBI1 [Hydra vulgaris]|uniref:Nuclease HARBI1 n=1 Tax=Hydra vulgaris TaxID=6087 RepID=A0ABM4BZ97_HYDVU
MTQAFACIDGTHIPIRRPLTNSQDFFCYKRYFFLSVQAVCDYKGYFMDVECMWPESVHDAKVFANSSINMKLRNAILPQTFQKPTKKAEKIPKNLIGDPAYPLLPFCMKEYKHCSNNEEVIFNNMLRAARNPIESAFDRLKARWGILTRRVFVLHNICEKTNSYVDDDLAKSQTDLIKKNEKKYKNVPNSIYSINEAELLLIRRTITDLIN